MVKNPVQLIAYNRKDVLSLNVMVQSIGQKKATCWIHSVFFVNGIDKMYIDFFFHSLSLWSFCEKAGSGFPFSASRLVSNDMCKLRALHD